MNRRLCVYGQESADSWFLRSTDHWTTSENLSTDGTGLKDPDAVAAFFVSNPIINLLLLFNKTI